MARVPDLKNESTADLTKFGGYTIETSTAAEKGQISRIAYCPICGHKEESYDDRLGKKNAINLSLGKVRAHMELTHKIKSTDSTDAKS